MERLYRKALELDPNNAVNTGNFANFLHTVSKDYDEAERFYRKALELDPSDAHNTGTFAIFMHEIRKNQDEAEKLHRKALELNPDGFATRATYLEFLIMAARFEETADVSEELWRRASTELSGFTHVVALLRGLLLLFDGKDDVEALSRLKTLFQEGLYDVAWDFESVLSAAESRLV